MIPFMHEFVLCVFLRSWRKTRSVRLNIYPVCFINDTSENECGFSLPGYKGAIGLGAY